MNKAQTNRMDESQLMSQVFCWFRDHCIGKVYCCVNI